MIDKQLMKDHVDEINGIIYSFLPEETDEPSSVAAAMNYSVRAGGKRLRPMFMQEIYRMFSNGKEEGDVLHAFMAAIEFIHTYSLVHDDLPCIDNDELRRGLATTHVKYGEACALLAGDALLTYAFEIILNAIEESDDPDDYMGGISSARVLAAKSGISGMVSGQCMDVYSEKNPDYEINEEKLKYIYQNKTSALLQASMMIGAILAGAADLEIAVIEKMAGYIGYAFQIRDDILDVSGNVSELGKPIGSDAENGKQTYVTVFGLKKAEEDVKKYTDQALEIYDKLRYKNAFLRELILDLVNRNY